MLRAHSTHRLLLLDKALVRLGVLPARRNRSACAKEPLRMSLTMSLRPFATRAA